jgi:tetratricopeptide (TPR) repeat protein
LATSSLADQVEVRGICYVRNSDEAYKAGQSANASLVLWGNVAEFAQDTFAPSFTFVYPILLPSDIDPLIFEVELNRVDSIDLPSKISARTTSIAAFVTGLIYLKEAENAEDYSLALYEFSSAINDTKPELGTLAKGSEQEDLLNKTLAIFYVMQGRAHAALNDNQNAFEDYSAAESLNPYYPSIYVAKGNYYYELREFSQAETQYQNAISLSLRKSASAFYGLANTLYYLNRYPESKEAYLKAINLIESKGEDASGVRIVLGVVYNLTTETQLALVQWNKVVQSATASQSQKEVAQKLIDSILNQTASPTIVSSTPTIAAIDTATPSPASMPGMTMVILTDMPTHIPTQRPTSPGGFPAPTATLFSTLFPPTDAPTDMPTYIPTNTQFPTLFPTPSPTQFPTATILAIYDFDSESIIGYMSCSATTGYTWNLELLPDGTIFYYSTVELYGSTYAGFYVLDAQMICRP